MELVVVPRLCLSGEGVWQHGEYLRLLVPALRNGRCIYINHLPTCVLVVSDAPDFRLADFQVVWRLLHVYDKPDSRLSKRPEIRPNMKQKPKTFLYWKMQVCSCLKLLITKNKIWVYRKCNDYRHLSPKIFSYTVLKIKKIAIRLAEYPVKSVSCA